ncbi:MAG: hypothetical protein KC621_34545, partial [Myxococcales bacterium]|nr:hypothetical protein [Myxococcales bacterium]
PDGTRWDGFPFVKNLERWLVQRDGPGAISARGTDRHARELDPYNGVAWEGRRTDHAAGQDHLAFDVDAVFRDGRLGDATLLLTFRDVSTAAWSVEYTRTAGPTTTPAVQGLGDGAVRTAAFELHDVVLGGAFPGDTDWWVWNGGQQDIELTFARMIPR